MVILLLGWLWKLEYLVVKSDINRIVMAWTGGKTRSANRHSIVFSHSLLIPSLLEYFNYLILDVRTDLLP